MGRNAPAPLRPRDKGAVLKEPTVSMILGRADHVNLPVSEPSPDEFQVAGEATAIIAAIEREDLFLSLEETPYEWFEPTGS